MAEDSIVEIRQYVRIAWRWLWLIAGLPVLVLVVSLLRGRAPQAPGYVATMRFSVGVVPEQAEGGSYTYDRYYTWLTAEYLIDDLAEVVRSREIAEAVAQEAARKGLARELGPGTVQGSTTGGKLHRILTVSLTWGDLEELEVLARATATVLSEGRAPYFEQLRQVGTPVVMHLIDPPAISPIGVSLRSRVEVPLRTGLGLLAGIALAFFLEYLDDSVRDPSDLTVRGVPVLGVIPRRSGPPWSERRVR
ncbi:MAG: hypothetical protein K6V36_02375 [Anaerolineae bacterium]|nr:hypothetical protein [Anaerolineae bacterium]